MDDQGPKRAPVAFELRAATLEASTVAEGLKADGESCRRALVKARPRVRIPPVLTLEPSSGQIEPSSGQKERAPQGARSSSGHSGRGSPARPLRAPPRDGDGVPSVGALCGDVLNIAA